MTRPVKIRIVRQVLKDNGWIPLRQAGSHQTWARPQCRCGALSDVSSDESSDDSDAPPPVSPVKRSASRASRAPSRAGSRCSSPVKKAAVGFPPTPTARKRGKLRIDTSVADTLRSPKSAYAGAAPKSAAAYALEAAPFSAVECGSAKLGRAITLRERRRAQAAGTIRAWGADETIRCARTPAARPAGCICLQREFDSPIHGARNFASVTIDAQNRITHGADRFTLVSRDPVDPKCIMTLKGILANVPAEW